MKCSGMEKISKLYEAGEADYFQRKAFEKHVRECPSCRKKYRELILLSALLLSSAKTPDRNYLAETLWAYFLKGIFIAGVVSIISFAGVSIAMNTVERKEMPKLKENTVEYRKIETDAPEILPAQNTTETENKKENKNRIKIRAEEGSKSVNIEVDNDTMKINKRTENSSK